jgi:predicted Zn-dependent protease
LALGLLMIVLGADARAADVAVPDGIKAELLHPASGPQRKRAELSLEKLAPTLPEPDYLADADADGDGPEATDEAAPLAAQRAYAHARQAYRNGKAFDAVRKLLIAQKQAPNAPEIARLLGRIYTDTGNKVRGATFLETAVRLDPDDLPTVFLLGRFALERSQWEKAAAILLHARQIDRQADEAEADPAQRALLSYYLGVALQNAGYASAAADEYRAYLDADRQFTRTTPRVRELAFVDQSRAATWMTLGDLYHQLDEPKRALEAYRTAAQETSGETVELGLRRVYTLLRLGRADEAEALVIERVRTSGTGDQSLPLVRYYLREAESAELIRQLEQIYENDGRTPAMALAVAELLPEPAAQALLLRHVKQKPADHGVFLALLRSALQREEGEKRTRVDRTALALDQTRQAAAAAPSHAGAYITMLFEAVGDPRVVDEAYAELAPEVAAEAYAQAIHGVALRRLGRYTDARAALRSALEAAPDSPVLRIEQARVLIAQEKIDEAAALPEGDWPRGDIEVLLLRTHVLAEAGKVGDALELLQREGDEALSRPRVAIEFARLLLREEKVSEAERVLNDALNAHPDSEVLYRFLLDHYRTRVDQGDRNYTEPLQALMRRLLSTLPSSRTARLLEAELRMSTNDFDRAEQILDKLLEDDPRDLDALGALVQLYMRSERRPMAIKTQERLLLAKPEGLEQTVELTYFYDSLGRYDDAVAHLKEALLRPDPEDPATVANLLWVMMLREDPDAGAEAQRLLAEAAERFPAHASDIRYQQASLWNVMGEPKRSTKVLAQIVEDDPNHAPANNDLGYSLADQGKDLERARAMIERAVEQDPDSSHYLDSMGWVLYKTGDFEAAVEWLRRAVDAEGGQHPIILDHLGDALYRRGRTAEAAANWGKARALLDLPEQAEAAETDGLSEVLDAKIAAVRAGQEPELAPVAKGSGDGG